MTDTLSPRINAHVERLHRYLPFSPSHDRIYEEYVKPGDSPDFETRALSYLRALADSGEPSLVVLTGDAGHGKTHLCRRLIEAHQECDASQARTLLISHGTGTESIRAPAGSVRLPLLIHKDFSEPQPEAAAAFLENAGSTAGAMTVICANEGRLRSITSAQGAAGTCSRIHDLLQEGYRTGTCTDGKGLHVLNLNYQSVAAPGQPMVGEATRKWTEERRWRTCRECSSRPECPIFRNRTMLTEGMGATRVGRLTLLLGTAERLGAVITIRELLMTLAYLLTGGLRCADVHRRVQQGRGGWQHEFAFYNLVFTRPANLPEQALGRIPVLARLAQLDPGLVAERLNDERLLKPGEVFEPGELDLQFHIRIGRQALTADASNGIDDLATGATTRNERRDERAAVDRVVRSLRRRAYFDDALDEPSVTTRFGFRHGEAFTEIVRGGLTPQRAAQLKNLLVAGLHVLQGLRRSNETSLRLVDPAFGRATARAAIIAGTIPPAYIRLTSTREAWTSGNGSGTLLSDSVDWIDRDVLLRIRDGKGDWADLTLGLAAFECLARAGSGYAAEEFYAPELRRIRTFLGSICERLHDRDGEVQLYMRGTMLTVSIDDGLIQLSGGN